MGRIRQGLICAGALLTVASATWANAGTPLMWAGPVLILANVPIALIEAIVILPFVRRGWWAWLAVPGILLLANYFSTFFGYSFLIPAGKSWAAEYLRPDPLGRVMLVYAATLLGLLAATVVLEWPFVYWALGRRRNRLLVSILTAAAAQVVTYALVIAPMYMDLSQTTLITEARQDPALIHQAGNAATVFFLGADDGDLYRIQLDGTGLQKLKTLGAGPKAELGWLPSEGTGGFVDRLVDKAGNFDLMLIPNRRQDSTAITVLPKAAFSALVAPDNPEAGLSTDDPDYSTILEFNRTRGNSRRWNVQTGIWSASGLWIRGGTDQHDWTLALETHLVAWKGKNVSMLPNDLILCQFGDMILLLDPATRRSAVLARGRSPLVAIEPEPTIPLKGNYDESSWVDG